MKTFLIIWFSSDGRSPTDVSERLLSLGFRPIEGQYDYVYEWDSSADLEDIVKFGNQVQNTLRGSGVMFKLETI